jgi:hypothetical protein
MEEPAYYVLPLTWVHLSDKNSMFNVSVSDSYTTVCHSSTEGLGPTYQRNDMSDFTTLKGDDHLTTSMNNSKDPTFMGPNVLRAITFTCVWALHFKLTCQVCFLLPRIHQTTDAPDGDGNNLLLQSP